MSDNIVGLNGEPVEPEEVDYDRGVADILERALADVKSGKDKFTGVGVVLVFDHPTNQYGIDGSYHGPRLSLLTGCARLMHKLNRDLDKQ